MKTVFKTSLNAKNISIIGLLGSLTIVLGLTPLGFIPIGPTRATIMHIPVIVGSILYGPLVGAFVGLIFGIFSIINALVNMTVVSFVFLNPLVSVVPRVLIGVGSHYAYRLAKSLGGQRLRFLLIFIGGLMVSYLLHGSYRALQEEAYFNLIINLILFGIVCLMVFYSFKYKNNQTADLLVASILGSLINTVGVLSMVYLLYGERFVLAMGADAQSARKFIVSLGLLNGIPEAVIAAILVTSVCNAIIKRK